MGNSFGAVKEKSKESWNYITKKQFIRESIRSQGNWLFPRNTTYGFCFSLTFYLLLAIPGCSGGCSGVPGLSKSGLEKSSVC